MEPIQQDIKKKEPIHLRQLKNKHELLRKKKPIGFNIESEGDILKIADKINLSKWIKNLLRSLSLSEIDQLKKTKNLVKNETQNDQKDAFDLVPIILVEKMLDNGAFDLDEYLAARNKKIVDADHDNKYSHSNNHGEDADLNQDPEYDDVSQISQYDE